MSEKKGLTHIYYHFLEGSSFLLADERDKWKFLESIKSIQQKKALDIYAFCLTDSSAYMVMETSSIAEIQKLLVQILEYVGETSAHAGLLQDRGAIIQKSASKELKTLQDVVRTCMHLHRKPLEYGYVSRIADYWWSSYISYMGIYQWVQVNCHPVSLYFSADPEEARNRFRRYHLLNEQKQ